MNLEGNGGGEVRRDRPSGLSGPDRPGLGAERRSSPRLEAFDYVGPYAYSLTLRAADRAPVFSYPEVTRGCVDALEEASGRQKFTVHAFCFMPDHLHLLVEGSDASNLVAFVKHLKQLSSYRYRLRTTRKRWQRSYYDHVLRRQEDLHVAAQYIWNNPVRAGLATNREDYPLIGPAEALARNRPEGLSLQNVSR